MDKVFDAIEYLPKRLFHRMHRFADNRAYKVDAKYRAIEDAQKRYGGNIMSLGETETEDGQLLTLENTLMYQSKTAYQVFPKLQWFWNVMYWATLPRGWYHEVGAARMRVIKGYDNHALWDFFSWHSTICAKALSEYRANLHGHPCCAFTDDDGVTREMTFEDWQMIVDKIIAGFEAAKCIDECTTNEVDREKYQKIFDEGMKLFSEYYFGLWD